MVKIIRFGEYLKAHPKVGVLWRLNPVPEMNLLTGRGRARIPEAVILSCMVGLSKSVEMFQNELMKSQRAVDILTHETMPFMYAHDIWSLLPQGRTDKFIGIMGRENANPLLEGLELHYGKPAYFNLADHLDTLSLPTYFNADPEYVEKVADMICGPDFQPDHRVRALAYKSSQDRGDEQVHNIFRHMIPEYALEYLTVVGPKKAASLIFGWVD